MRIPKSVRSHAALLCSAAASNPTKLAGKPFQMLTSELALHLDTPIEAIKLAAQARAHIRDRDGSWIRTREGDAEAEALLRTGWSPPSYRSASTSSSRQPTSSSRRHLVDPIVPQARKARGSRSIPSAHRSASASKPRRSGAHA